MNFSEWTRLFLIVGTISISQFGAVILADDWRPKGNAFQIREAREECSLIKSVHISTKAQLELRMVDLDAVKVSTKQQYQVLKECQQRNGIVNMDSEEGQTKTAYLCAESYDLWILEGTHLTTVEDEVKNLRQEVSTLEGAVSRKCFQTIVAKR